MLGFDAMRDERIRKGARPGRASRRGLAGSGLRRILAAVAAAFLGTPSLADAPVIGTGAFEQAVATAAAESPAIAAWYRDSGYDALWTGPDDSGRRSALLDALAGAADHGLPPTRYGRDALIAGLRAARTEGDRARLEVAMTRAYLSWAEDLQAGLLEPDRIDRTIVREITRPEPETLLRAISAGDPGDVLRSLLPQSDVYGQLMRASLDLKEVIANGGWGPPVPGGALEPGASGARVVALRDRLMAMGYLERSVTRDYDRRIAAAVLAFQRDHGLAPDGVAGAATLAEINRPPEERLESILVAMERERWMHIDRSGRLVWVNLPDFTASIVEDGRVLFSTRAVIGREDMDRRTPEFSDEMEHMVVNPSWGVPRSIVVKEYLPMLQRNPNAVSYLQLIDGQGRVVPRGAVNFAAYSAKTFPFAMRQPPSDSNALGRVKFMFPNRYNIYLHDTPSKSLFAHERRAYSHGCIRLADPFDFAHVLLSAQSSAAEAEFAAELATRQETVMPLERSIPIHLVYFTAYPDARGHITYRGDVYGRDAKLWAALAEAGVALPEASR